MSSKNALRRRKARMSSRSSLSLECLESRLALFAPIGNVNATLLGSTLLLTGDALDNALVVSTATGGRMAVLGGLGTTINGSTSAFVTSRAVTSIVANLNAGNDVIGFTNSADDLIKQLDFFGFSSPFDPGLQGLINTATVNTPMFTLPGSVTVTTASGDDVVGIIGTVGGSVAANLGSSSTVTGPGQGNGFAIGVQFGSSVDNRIGGSLSVVGGDQRDGVMLHDTDVAGAVTTALGNGDNFTDMNGSGGMTIGSFAYSGGTGGDGVNVANPVTIRNGVSVFAGPRGVDGVVLSSDVSIGGGVVVNTGAGADSDVVLILGTIKRDVSVTTGAGNDLIGSVFASIGGGLVINSAAGNDSILCSRSSIGLNTVIDAGAGNDEVRVDRWTTTSSLFVYLGPGNDRLDLRDVRAFSAFLYGGPGANTLNIDASSRSGIRTLKYFQFQTVNTIV